MRKYAKYFSIDTPPRILKGGLPTNCFALCTSIKKSNIKYQLHNNDDACSTKCMLTYDSALHDDIFLLTSSSVRE